jgi:hypothetical protein
MLSYGVFGASFLLRLQRASHRARSLVSPSEALSGRWKGHNCHEGKPPMYACANCRTEVQDDDNWCENCGCNLWLQTDHLRLQWTPTIDEANNIHWLAQSKRRLEVPIESTEDISFLAFEYAWKVINHLYNALAIPKIHDPATGKNREPTAKESVLHLFKRYDVANAILELNRDLIKGLCDCVLQVSDHAYYGDIRGYVKFDNSVQKNLPEIRQKATEQCNELAKSLDTGDDSLAIERLIDVLLSIRNARVHASVMKTATKPPVGGSPQSSRRSRGTGITDDTGKRHDYEIYTVAEIIRSMGEIVISAKIDKPLKDIQEWVRSRVGQLACEIYERVQSWGPDLSRITGKEGQNPETDAAGGQQLIDALSHTIIDHEQRLKALEGI